MNAPQEKARPDGKSGTGGGAAGTQGAGDSIAEAFSRDWSELMASMRDKRVPAVHLNAEEIALALDGKKSGREWKACCPAHDDQNPSLSIAEGDGGRVLVTCRAGCTQEAVIEALRKRGLWPASNGSGGTHAALPPVKRTKPKAAAGPGWQTLAAAGYLGISVRTLRTWTRANVVPSIRPGGGRVLLYSRPDLDRALQRFREGCAA